MNMETGDIQPLTDKCGTFSGYPAWSPDGSELVILRENEDGALNLHVISADGSGSDWQTTLESGRLDKQAYPCWSSDGHIYFTSVAQSTDKNTKSGLQATNHNSGRSNRSDYATDTDFFDDRDGDDRYITCPKN